MQNHYVLLLHQIKFCNSHQCVCKKPARHTCGGSSWVAPLLRFTKKTCQPNQTEVALTSCMCQHKIQKIRMNRAFTNLSCRSWVENWKSLTDQRPTLERIQGALFVLLEMTRSQPSGRGSNPAKSTHEITKWSWKSPRAVVKTAVIHGLMMLSLRFYVVPAFEILVLWFLPLRHLGLTDSKESLAWHPYWICAIKHDVARHCDRDLILFDAPPGTYSKALQTNCTTQVWNLHWSVAQILLDSRYFMLHFNYQLVGCTLWRFCTCWPGIFGL